ncbi:MAG: helix-turn-helix transcriptional regulator [Alphaproteobacteria bacterium]|nr:helix-turn-helix transcriptional regulator [Alphaproteobacteria bacterium]
MEIYRATAAFGALAQDTRLEVFRLLVRAGRDGMAAGDIARHIGIPQNTLSAHLSVLSRGHLVRSRRDGRSIIYSVDFDGTQALLSYLMEDCCLGTPASCGPAIASALPDHHTVPN